MTNDLKLVTQLGHKKDIANLAKLTNLANLETFGHRSFRSPDIKYQSFNITHIPNGPTKNLVPFGQPCPLRGKTEISLSPWEK